MGGWVKLCLAISEKYVLGATELPRYLGLVQHQNVHPYRSTTYSKDHKK